MDPDRFWQLIAVMGEEEEGTDDAANEALLRALSQLPPADILAFQRRFNEAVGRAFRHNLRGAAYLINGVSSDDGFHAFRYWLVSAGKQVYENALANPDSLANMVEWEGIYESWGVAEVARFAWQAVTGRDEKAFSEELERLGSLSSTVDAGEDWDFDNDEEMWRRLPRLARLYLEGSGSDCK
jgi:hypothetical protein